MDTKQFWASGRKPETVVHLPGGSLVVPGHAKTDRGLIALVTKAIKAGTARVEPQPNRTPAAKA